MRGVWVVCLKPCVFLMDFSGQPDYSSCILVSGLALAEEFADGCYFHIGKLRNGVRK